MKTRPSLLSFFLALAVSLPLSALAQDNQTQTSGTQPQAQQQTPDNQQTPSTDQSQTTSKDQKIKHDGGKNDVVAIGN